MHFKLVDEIQPVSPDYLQTVTSSSHLFILRVIFTKIMFKKSLDLFTLRNFDKSQVWGGLALQIRKLVLGATKGKPIHARKKDLRRQWNGPVSSNQQQLTLTAAKEDTELVRQQQPLSQSALGVAPLNTSNTNIKENSAKIQKKTPTAQSSSNRGYHHLQLKHHHLRGAQSRI